jgi:REP element-mobilizing transposase RayT
MARRLRVQFPGAIYHLINRGNYRRDLFATPGAAKSFESALGEACQRFDWVVHAFAAMRNHFHLAVTTRSPNLSDGMHWLQTTFALRFNRFRRESGHLFQGRYQSPLIENATALGRVVDYIHLNPVEAGLCPAAQPAQFPWGSLSRFVHGPRPPWLSAGEWLAALPLRDSPDGWSKYVSRLQNIARNPDAKQMAEFEDIARGRPVGTHAWQRALAREYEHLALEQDVSAAEILPLKQSRWTAALEEALLHHRISPAAIIEARLIPHWKAEVAVRVRRASGAPWPWIAAQLRVPQPASLRAAASWLGRR